MVGRVIDGYLSGSRDGGGGIGYFVIVFVLDMVFGLFASMIAMWFSRQREFRADAGGATLAGRDKMIAALERLCADLRREHAAEAGRRPSASAAASAMACKRLFMSHPPLEERIEALRNWQPTASAVRQSVVA